MYREFAELGPYERHAIDTSALDAQATVVAVRALLSRGALVLTSLHGASDA